MSQMKRHLENLSVTFEYGGEINDDVMKLSGDLHDFYQANGISDFSELPGAGDWGKAMDLIAEQHDGYGTLRGWYSRGFVRRKKRKSEKITLP